MGKLIVAKVFKGCPKSNKSPNLVTMIVNDVSKQQIGWAIFILNILGHYLALRFSYISIADLVRSENLSSFFRGQQCDQIGQFSVLFLKIGQPRPLFRLCLVFSNKHYNYYNKYMWKNVHLVYGARIRTHDLWNMSLFP